MKKYLLIGFILLTCGSCKKTTWEYKVVKLMPEGTPARDGSEAFDANLILVPDSELNKLGKEGWELVMAQDQIETAFPNFGKAEYVTGLQPNVRTGCLLLIFKREKN